MEELPATQIGPYTIERELGRGGMGVVYLGRDTKLDRPVAIKALPEHLAEDPERMARFEREAKLLASLSHPNIAGVYGLEEHEGARYLVMEFVEGESLAQILERGAIATEEAIRIGAQVASGVESAHEAGVIHRDLKPGNIVVTPRGEAKVLDFGLAKEVEGRSSSLDLSHSPTATFPTARSPATAAGQIMGTAAYVSPEQARGKQLDRRTDIWSFGCVLYEMLTGVGPFAGETATDSFGAILHKEPDWSTLPDDTPPTIHLLLKRTLAKDPSRRLRDIGDARVELDEALRDPSATSLNLAGAALNAGGARAASPAGWIAAALLLIVTLAMGALMLRDSPEAPEEPVRLRADLGIDGLLQQAVGAPFTISPDGSAVVFLGAQREGEQRLLYIRRLGAFEANPLAGTAGATQPVFSPDGEWVCFFADGALRKIAISGGAPITLASIGTSPRGASWGDGGLIAFTPDTTAGLWAVSENGGEPRQLTTPSDEAEERSHRWPHFLPGSQALLFVSQTRGEDFNRGTIEALSLDSAERTVLHTGGSNPKYTPSGHLLFGSAGTVYACRFDAESLTTLGAPVPMVEGVLTAPPNGGVSYNVSDTGRLLYVEGTGAGGAFSTLTWLDREGNRTNLTSDDLLAPVAALSPDQERVAMQVYSDSTEFDLWVFELERRVLSRLTFAEGPEMNAVWSPDGQMIAYAAQNSGGTPNIFTLPADGSGEPIQITSGDDVDFPISWSPDGRTLAFHRLGTGRETFAAWTVEVGPDGAAAEPQVLLETQFETRFPIISPDGTQFAYSSNETGRPEVYLRSFPTGGGRAQVSIDGGSYPVWSDDGAALYYWWAGSIYSCEIGEREDGRLRIGRPQQVVEHRLSDDFFYPQFNLTADNERFLVMSRAARNDEDTIVVKMILNWFTDLESKAGPAR